MLCKTCMNIFKGPLGLGEECLGFDHQISYKREHYHHVKDIYQAARQGCFICDRLWQKAFWRYSPSATLHLEECSLISPKKPEDTLSLLIMYGFGPDQFIEVFSLEPTLGIRSYLQSGPHADRTDSAATLDLASMWLKKCITSHPECNRDIMATKMPTRLLKLGHPTPEHLQLCITKHAKTKDHYMTLSHCWGSAKFLKLTAENSRQLSNGVHLSLLPQTFQDAVKIARRLGVQYLWIDSLCIRQDSDEDWQREASMMGDVYKGALCNIAATGSADSRGGCFRKREPRLVEPCIITTEYTDHLNNEYHIQQSDYLRNILHGDEPLFRRGWVVQERVLPPRVLHFGRRQAFWECSTENACETYPLGLLPTMYDTSHCLKRQSRLAHNINARNQPGTHNFKMLYEDVYNFWGKIVQTYSQCNLTRKEDKLVAISGLAKEVYTALGGHDEYLAGLWRRNILSQLLWSICEGWRTYGVRPERYRAPSWSWASIDGRLSTPAPTNPNFLVTLIDAHVDHSTENAFGQVKNGYIRLRGPLLTVTFKEKEPDDELMDSEYDAFLNGQQTEDVSPQMDVDGLIANHLHFMPFYVKSGQNGPYALRGLLLQSTGMAKGQFRRCGVLELVDKAMVTGWPSWTRIQNHNWLEYEKVTGSEYTISII